MLTAVPVNIGLAPTGPQGPRCTRPITYSNPFQANNQPFSPFTNVDLIMEDSEGVIDNIQTLFFDTSLCPSNVYLVFQNTGQRLVLPMKSQGYIPIACGNEVRFQYGVYEPGGVGYCFTIQFFNVPIGPAVWSTQDTMRTFIRAAALPAAGGTVQFNGGVGLPGAYNPGVDMPSLGTAPGSFGTTNTAQLNTQAWQVQTLGLKIIILGSASVSTDFVFSMVGFVAGWGGTATEYFEVTTDANGNAIFKTDFPGDGILVNGFNWPSIVVPAVTTPTTYQANLYFKL